MLEHSCWCIFCAESNWLCLISKGDSNSSEKGFKKLGKIKMKKTKTLPLPLPGFWPCRPVPLSRSPARAASAGRTGLFPFLLGPTPRPSTAAASASAPAAHLPSLGLADKAGPPISAVSLLPPESEPNTPLCPLALRRLGVLRTPPRPYKPRTRARPRCSPPKKPSATALVSSTRTTETLDAAAPSYTSSTIHLGLHLLAR